MQLPEGATIISASEDTSKCFIIVGGVHGNEPAGIRAINMVATLAREEWKLAGAIFGLIGNPRACEKNIRFVDENLNRAFARAKNPDSYEAQRANEIDTWFQELTNMYKQIYVLDLHSVSIGEARIVIFSAANPTAEEWVRTISPIPFRMKDSEHVLPSTIMGAAERLGGIAITIECGNHSSQTGTMVAMEHIENALHSLNMLTNQTVSFRSKINYEGAPRTYLITGLIHVGKGFAFDFPVASETPLNAGQVYAHDENGEHRASMDCYIMMPTENPDHNDTDAGFLAVRTE